MTPTVSATADAPSGSSYYGRPVIKPPVWKWPVPAYFFAGGLAGASASLAAAARLAGDDRLARGALGAALVGAVVSPPLLIEDLGRSERFLNMMRVAKVTSPMSVGTWVLSAFVPSVVGAAACDFTGVAPRLGRVLGMVGGALGPVIATYPAVLVSDTAVPVWHESRRELPFVFAAGAAASAGAAAAMLTPPRHARAARRMLVLGSVGEVAASTLMERAHHEVTGPYRGDGRAARLGRWAKGLTVVGAAGTAVAGGRRRSVAVAAAVATLAGSLLERFCVFGAGIESALDPAATVGPQRRRLPASPG